MTIPDTAIRARADRVRAELAAQDDAWGTGGWTRRRFLAGVGMAGVAALGTQLVTSRAAYAAAPSPTDRTLIVIFLRGAADGLRILQPNSAALGLDHVTSVRPDLVLGSSQLIPLPGTAGWALNNRLQPLYDALWATGELAFVPGILVAGGQPPATSRRSSTWRRAARTPRRADGWSGRSSRWGRAPRSGRCPRARPARSRWPVPRRR